MKKKELACGAVSTPHHHYPKSPFGEGRKRIAPGAHPPTLLNDNVRLILVKWEKRIAAAAHLPQQTNVNIPPNNPPPPGYIKTLVTGSLREGLFGGGLYGI